MASSRAAGHPLTWVLPGLLVVVTMGIVQVGTQSTETPINCTATIHQTNGSLCLWLVKDVKTWQDADDDCAVHGGYLVAVTSPEINDVVYSIMKNNSLSSVWLGVTEKVSTWKWLKGNMEIYNQGCYKEDPSKREFENRFTIPNNSHTLCSEKCQSEGFTYAGLQTRTQCWCGDSFGQYGHGDCNLLCNDRSLVCGGNVSGQISNFVFHPGGAFSNWERGQPNNHQFYQACVVMDDYNDFQWNDLKCTEPSGIICELDLDKSLCLNRNFRYNDTWGCYVISNFTMTFFDGLYYCHQREGRPLTLENQDKRDYFVNVLLQGKNNTGPDAFFIGLTRTQWIWSTGEPLVYSFWGQGWPNGKDQQCAIVDRQGKWNDVTCSAPYNYICQRGSSPRPPTTLPPTTTTPTTTTPTTTPKPCDTACKARLEAANRAYQLRRTEKKQLLYYCLIGGGAGLFVILVIAVICTVCCIKNHMKEKKEKRFDYFFGVDVSRPEDDKGFKSSKNPKSIREEDGTVAPPDETPVTSTDGAALISETTPADEKTILKEQHSRSPDSNVGIENHAFSPADEDIATSTPRTDSLETKHRMSNDVPDVVMTSDMHGSRPTSQAVDVTSVVTSDMHSSRPTSQAVDVTSEVTSEVTSDASQEPVEQSVDDAESSLKDTETASRPRSVESNKPDRKEGQNGSATFGADMMNYDFDNPESSQMLF